MTAAVAVEVVQTGWVDMVAAKAVEGTRAMASMVAVVKVRGVMARAEVGWLAPVEVVATALEMEAGDVLEALVVVNEEA